MVELVDALAAVVEATVIPRAENPWPETVGIDLPFAAAGACGVVGEFVSTVKSGDRRELIVRRWGVFGFLLGAFLYAVALLIQLLSML